MFKPLQSCKFVEGWLKEMGPEIMFNDFASNNEACDECPPGNN